MEDIINRFESYLFLHKKVSINTYKAYLKDVQEFVSFIAEKSLREINSQDIALYLLHIRKRHISSTTIMRKVAALKLFVRYLHEKWGLPDVTHALVFNTILPVPCSEEKVNQLLSSYRKLYQSLSYKELRNYVLLYLATHTKVGLKYIAQLKKQDFNSSSCTVTVVQSQATKEIELPSSFFTVLEHYISILPYSTPYLFPVKLGSIVKPISRSALWALLKSIIQTPKDFSVKENNNEPLLEEEVQKAYKSNHPRS